MPSELWTFTLDFYAKPGIEQACLRLQANGANVCAVLCGVWLGCEGVSCTHQRLAQIGQLATPWHNEVVQPLRVLRTRWKSKAGNDEHLKGLRDQLKGLELEAERELLRRLEELTRDWPRRQAFDADAWLKGLTAEAAGDNHDALQLLRVVAGSA